MIHTYLTLGPDHLRGKNLLYKNRKGSKWTQNGFNLCLKNLLILLIMVIIVLDDQAYDFILNRARQ